jgi:hypothetical protein
MWKNQPLSDCCCLKVEEIQRLNPDVYELYQAQHALETSSFQAGEKLTVS